MSALLDKLAKMIAKAESTEFPEEAESFMAKAQELAAAASIDLAVARAHQANKEKKEVPEERSVKVGERVNRNAKSGNGWRVELFIAIAEANDCKCMISQNQMYVFPTGFPSDLDVVESLYASIVVQMISACDKALKNGANREKQMALVTRREEIEEDDRDWGGWDNKGIPYDEQGEPGYNWSTCQYRQPHPPPKFRNVPVRDEEGNKVYEEKMVSVVDGRTFRANFYDAYIERMRSRLYEAKRRAREAHDAGLAEDEVKGTELAIRTKQQEVNDIYQQRAAKARGSWSAPEAKQYSSKGRAEGAGAASVASIGTGHGLGGNKGVLG